MSHPMSPSSTIRLERTSPQTATVTFANPPVNLVISETVVALHKIVRELDNDPDIQVVVFESAVPDFFFNHFDGAEAGNLPVPEHEDDAPVWTDLVLRLSKAAYVSIAAIRGRTRGAGNELALACDLRYASREKAIFGQPEVGIGLVPGGGGAERLPRAIGRDRALEAILGSADYDADLAERWGWVTRTLPDTELDAFIDATVTRLASFDRQTLATAKAMIGRATLPPDADLIASYGAFVDTLTGPALLPRAMALGALAADKGLDVEYQLGEYLGQVNQNL
jgi:enoyl-CoA hydratase/carnithine racemase